jgi:c-di-GMP-binding flagellar brake protein YcgR
MPQGDGLNSNQPTKPVTTSPAARPAVKSEKAIVFSRPEQIIEILKEAEKLQLQVLIRYSNDGKAIRGVIERAHIMTENGIRISSISPAGDAVLASCEAVKVEFVLLSKKLYFVTRIRARSSGKILVQPPEKLYAVERRRNARFAIPNGIAAFMEFDDLHIDSTRFNSPFNPDITGKSKKHHIRLKLDDISLGGSALMTRFAHISNVIKPSGDAILSAKLFLPKLPPIVVPVGVRWIKKSTSCLLPGTHDDMRQIVVNRIVTQTNRTTDPQFTEIIHRYGTQFAEVSEELNNSLRDFINICQTAQSV